MSDIFVEVNEAMKQERLEKLWQKYGGFFLGLISVIIIGTAVNAGYVSWKTSKNIKQTDILLDVIDNATISQNLTGSLLDINLINTAGMLASQGKINEALKYYNMVKLSNNPINKLALYMKANISQDLKSIKDIASEKDNPWQYHAALDAALIEANMNNNYSIARKYIATIIDGDNVPKTLKQKAQSIDILYALKEKVEQKTKAEKTQENHDDK